MHEQLNQIINQTMTQRSEYEREVIKKAWSDENFKQRLISDPKSVIAEELDETLPENIEFEVLQETENKVYFVLPSNPTSVITSEEALSEEALETVAGGICRNSSRDWKEIRKFWSGNCYKNANSKV